MAHAYRTTNTITGEVYIGKSHKEPDASYLGSGLRLMRQLKKYGHDVFRKEIIADNVSDDLIDDLEVKLIAEHREIMGREMVLNIADGGTGGYVLKNASEERISEWKKNLSAAPRSPKSEEEKAAASKRNKGKQFGDPKKTAATIKAMWADPNSVYNSEEYRKNLSKGHTGIPCKEETKRKIGKANSGGNSGMAVKIQVGDEIFETRRAAAKAHNISEPAVTKRCKSNNFKLWKIINK